MLDSAVNKKIATEIFDTDVNLGRGLAANFLQRASNVSNLNGKAFADLKVDNIIGPKTIGLLNRHKQPENVYKVLNCLQGARYIELIESKPVYEKFFKSWYVRVF